MNRYFAVLLMLTVGACSESPTRQDRPIPTDQAAQAALSTPAGEAGRLFEGDAYFGRIPEKNIVFFAFDGGERGQAPDRVIDQVFVLQSNAYLPGELPSKLSDVQVVYTRGSVLVRGPGGDRIRFTVSGKDAVGIEGNQPLEWRGYGLSRRTGQWPVVDGVPLVAALSSALASCRRGFGGAQVMGSCDSGGKGSTGCSTSCAMGGSCSVSCGQGYYSCCSIVGCSCTCVNSVAPDPGPG